MPLLSPSAPLCFSQLNNSLTTFSCNSFTPFLHRTVPICKARHIGGVYFRTESNVLHKYVSKCKESGRDLYTEEGTTSFDWGDEEEEEIDEDEGLPWEGAVIYKRNASILHLEYCTTLERLGLGNLSTDVSKNKASVMGLWITKAVKDFPNGAPVQISIDVTRKKKKLRLDGIIKTVLTLVCNRYFPIIFSLCVVFFHDFTPFYICVCCHRLILQAPNVQISMVKLHFLSLCLFTHHLQIYLISQKCDK